MDKIKNLFGLSFYMDEDDIAKKIENAKNKFADIEHQAQVYTQRAKLFKVLVWALCATAMCLLFSASLIPPNSIWGNVFAITFAIVLIGILISSFYLYHMDGIIWDAQYYTASIYYGIPEQIHDFISKENVVKAEINYIGHDLYLSLYSKKDVGNINEVPRRVDFGGFEEVESADIGTSFVNINAQKYYKKI